MGSKPPSRKRKLSAEEAELWAHVMRDAKALRRKDRAAEKLAEDERNKIADETEAGSEASSKRTEKPPEPSPATGDRPQPGKSAPPPLAAFEDRHRRKLAKNAQPIDARIDLHGMRQKQAHSALRGFLFASAARGHRNVLVITGKGTRGELERRRDFYMEERGVLRRLVPQWLGEPEFRGIVLSYTTASIRHGGEGALYVRLRKFSDG